MVYAIHPSIHPSNLSIGLSMFSIQNSVHPSTSFKLSLFIYQSIHPYIPLIVLHYFSCSIYFNYHFSFDPSSILAAVLFTAHFILQSLHLSSTLLLIGPSIKQFINVSPHFFSHHPFKCTHQSVNFIHHLSVYFYLPIHPSIHQPTLAFISIQLLFN